MAFLKQSVIYTVCALAFIYYQSDVASAIHCIACNSTETKECTADNITDNSMNCSAASTCFEVLYKDGNQDRVVRGCNSSCDSAELKTLQVNNSWSCMSCTSELCNNVSISYQNSSASGLISNFKLGSLLLSAAVTFYLY